MTAEDTGLEPDSGTVHASGIQLSYLVWGAATYEHTLVCLHGSGGNARHWGPLARALRPHMVRVVAFDLRGHGDSDQPATGYEVEDFARDLEAAVPALGLNRFDLVGSSLGSRIALMYAARNPAVVRRLVVVDLSFEMPEDAQQRMINGHRSRPRRFARTDEVLDWSRSNPSRARWTAAMHEEMGRYELKPAADGGWTWRYSPDAAIQALAAARRNMWPFAESLAMPTLLLRGAQSPVLTPASAAEMSKRIPNCTLVEVPGAGHGVPRDNPDDFNKKVLDFVLADAP